MKGPGYCFYADLCATYDVDLNNFEEMASLHTALARVNDAEHAEGRPLLGAVVIEQSSMLPDKRFFIQARTLGSYGGPLTGPKSQRYHDTEMKRVAAHWKAHGASQAFSKTAAEDKKSMPVVSAARTTEEIVIRWQQPGVRSGQDHFSMSEFSAPGSAQPREHVSVSHKGASRIAKYLLSVTGDIALIDYESFKRENTEAGIEVGRLRLRFHDADRVSLNEATWHPTGGKEFRAAIREVTYLGALVGAYAPAGGKLAESEEVPAERAGQTEFRRRLRAAYGGRCCITGCDVPEALDAAHIDPYVNPSHDHPKNGLLLRKDVRALFEAGLIAIDPMGMTVQLSPRARSFSEYNLLDGRKLRAPSHGFDAYAPDAEALTRRWKEFKK